MRAEGGTVVVRAGRLVDVVHEDVRDRARVVIRGDRIEAVEADAGPGPAGARVVDLTGCTVLPGLIDCHAHLIGEPDSGEYATMLARTGAEEALSGVRNARDTLLAGFTTVRDVGTFRAFVDVALRRAIEAGWTPGPRMRCAGAYVTVSSGGGDIPPVAPDVEVPRELRFGVADSADEVRRVVREILHRGADLIKVIATGAVMTRGTVPGAPEYSEEELRAAVEEAALYGAPVAAHAHGAEGIRRAVRAGVRSIEHGSLLDREGIELMAERGTFLVADVWNGDFIAEEGRRRGWPEEILRKNAETTEAQREGFRAALAAGVRIAFGTDAGIFPHGWNARQFGVMVRLGMTPMQAIRSATCVAAELLGWEDRVGAVEPGRFADLVAVPADPLDDVTVLEAVPFVMRGGAVAKDELP
ncbi:MAG TPA: amidohydrolase family protein [Actinomycetota bacterium]|nr:amidohydrolase family protein [Actinomycetota bacterium]